MATMTTNWNKNIALADIEKMQKSLTVSGVTINNPVVVVSKSMPRDIVKIIKGVGCTISHGLCLDDTQ